MTTDDYQIPDIQTKNAARSFIRELKNARKIYMEKPFAERSAIVKKEIDKRLKDAQERYNLKARQIHATKLTRLERRFAKEKGI